jgi:hypothetical protein
MGGGDKKSSGNIIILILHKPSEKIYRKGASNGVLLEGYYYVLYIGRKTHFRLL